MLGVTSLDKNGLSAYIAWIKEDVLANPKFQREIMGPNAKFSQKDVQRLTSAIAEAEECLVDAWKRPATAKKVTLKRKKDLDKLLQTIITHEAASKEFYDACFPNDSYVEKYTRDKEEHEKREAEARQKREARQA